jgi:hypothetical protein
MQDPNVLQETNRQGDGSNPKRTFTGLYGATVLLPIKIAIEFYRLARVQISHIQKDRNNNTIIEISEDIQECFIIQSLVPDPS